VSIHSRYSRKLLAGFGKERCGTVVVVDFNGSQCQALRLAHYQTLSRPTNVHNVPPLLKEGTTQQNVSEPMLLFI
jgi:hypothetical protein